MISDEEINRVSALSEDVLFGELGLALYSSATQGKVLGAKLPSLSALAENGKKWILNERAKLQEAICRNNKIQEMLKDKASLRAKLIRTIADVVCAIYTYVPCATIAELVVRDGLPQFCCDIWEQQASNIESTDNDERNDA